MARRARRSTGSLARLDGTIVCYAGPEQLPQMLQALVTHGRSEEESAALIYDGTLATQQTDARNARRYRAGPGSRRIDGRRIIAGCVAALREHLRWFDARPLFGKRVLVTRPRDQAAEMVRPEARGADAIEAPLIRIAPPEDYGPLDAACAEIQQPTGSSSPACTRWTSSSSGCWRHRWTFAP